MGNVLWDTRGGVNIPSKLQVLSCKGGEGDSVASWIKSVKKLVFSTAPATPCLSNMRWGSLPVQFFLMLWWLSQTFRLKLITKRQNISINVSDFYYKKGGQTKSQSIRCFVFHEFKMYFSDASCKKKQYCSSMRSSNQTQFICGNDRRPLSMILAVGPAHTPGGFRRTNAQIIPCWAESDHGAPHWSFSLNFPLQFNWAIWA